MDETSYREKICKAYYSKEGSDEEAVAWRVVRDIKYGIIEDGTPTGTKYYNIGNFFLVFEDLMRRDPSDIFSTNMQDLINVVMPLMCKNNSNM